MADYRSTLTGTQMDAALLDMAEHNSEAYAVGERNGIAVASDDVTYHNNARYYAQIASSQIVGDASSAVRWDTDQSEVLTDAQKAQARENIDAASDSDVVKITAQTLTTAQQEQARANIMAGGSNRNLLDNPWFTVNQRGVTSGTITNAAVVGPDRWDLFQCSWSVANNAITLAWGGGGTAAGFLQRTGPEVGYALVGKTCTISAYVNGTLYTKTVEIKEPSYGAQDLLLGGGVNIRVITDALSGNRGVEVQFRTTSTTNITIGPVKMEVGSVSTLANDAPPNYAEELAKCQFYAEIISAQYGFVIGNGFAVDTTQIRVPIKLAPKRGNLSAVTLTGSMKAGQASASMAVSGVTLNAFNPNTGFCEIRLAVTGVTIGQMYKCALDGGSKLLFSADL